MLLFYFAAKNVVCYLSSWSRFRPGDGAFQIDKMDPFLCTHIIYTFAGLDINGNIVSLDHDNDIRDSK
jgi:chitinase